MGSSENWQALGDGTLRAEEHDHGLGHIVPIPIYNAVFASLLVLTAVTVWAATQEFGPFNLAIALLIATVKAGIVTLIFMHLQWESKIIWGIVIYPIFIFLLIVLGTLGDASVIESIAPLAPDSGMPETTTVVNPYQS